MATRLTDAVLELKLDTSKAKKQAEDFEKGKEERREDDQEDRRKERKGKDESREKGKSRVAVIPGIGRGASRVIGLIKNLVALRVAEEIFGALGGGIREAGKGKFVEPLTNIAADEFIKLSAAITEARTLLGSLLTTTGQVKDFALAQKLLTGEVDPVELARFAQEAQAVNAATAAREGLKNLLTREAAGAVVAELAEKGKQSLIDAMAGAPQK